MEFLRKPHASSERERIKENNYKYLTEISFWENNNVVVYIFSDRSITELQFQGLFLSLIFLADEKKKKLINLQFHLILMWDLF